MSLDELIHRWDHLRAVAQELSDLGYLATYNGESSVAGLYHVAVTDTTSAISINIYSWETEPHILFIGERWKQSVFFDITDPNSITELIKVAIDTLATKATFK